MSIFKKVLIIIVIVLVSISILKITSNENSDKKYEIIKSIVENYNNISKETNYYYCKKYLYDNLTQTVWRKGDICLTHLTSDERSFFMLIDTKNNKTYQIDEINKTYEVSDYSNMDPYLLPKYMFINYILTDTPTTNTYKTMTEDSNLEIENGSYNDIECYIVGYGNTKIYHDKKTGIPIASYYDNELTMEVDYSIGKVTDSDLEIKIDFSQYTVLD